MAGIYGSNAADIISGDDSPIGSARVDHIVVLSGDLRLPDLDGDDRSMINLSFDDGDFHTIARTPVDPPQARSNGGRDQSNVFLDDHPVG